MSGYKIILFGTYSDNHLYSRNQEIRRALLKIGYQVKEVRPAEKLRIQQHKLISKLHLVNYVVQLLHEWSSLVSQIKAIRRGNLFLVPYPSHLDILLLKLLLVGKAPTIIMDAFLGLYDTVVDDRKIFRAGGLLAWCIKFFEKRALSIADRVLMDTAEQCEALTKLYQLEENKCYAVPVGIDESIWQPVPLPPDNEPFRAIFWGTFIPLHGVETIISAAQVLAEKTDKIHIELIGTGQTAEAVNQAIGSHWPANLSWREEIIPNSELADYVKKAHCVLGIFGTSNKADNVIPYKVYQALAMDRPVITRESKTLTSALSEYGIYTVTPGSGEALADSLLQLSNHPSQKTTYSPSDYYHKTISNQVIIERVKLLMSSLNDG